MYTIQAQVHFDSAHFLKGYAGACSNLHGHRWLVEATVQAESLIETGEKRAMVCDFKDLKNALNALVDPLDHQLVIERGSLSETFLSALKNEGFTYVEIPVRPTAEAMAKWFFDCLSEKLYGILEVKVYETPTNAASYRRPECI